MRRELLQGWIVAGLLLVALGIAGHQEQQETKDAQQCAAVHR